MTDDEIINLRTARALVIEHQRGSISLVQRHLCIGYNKAAALLEQLEREGVVGPINENGGRDVLVAPPADLRAEVERLTGEAAVMRELLRRCNTVLLTIEPESAAEHEAIGELSDAIERALGEAKGTLL